MNYFLIRLTFDTAVHFGPSDTAQSLSVSEDHLYADTVFSALCHTALVLDGEKGVTQLCDWVREGQLLLSDTMPWRGADCFLPKPFVLSQSKRELPAAHQKAMKKLAWIPVRSFAAFSDSVQGGEPFDPSAQGGAFGFAVEQMRAAVSAGDDAVPYRVGLYQFEENCGLYLLAATAEEEQGERLRRLFHALGLSGIGGKVRSGCGRFHLEEMTLLNTYPDGQARWLYQALTARTGRSLLLSASFPREEELEAALEGAAYQVIRRGGFAASDGGRDPLKKKTQYFFRAGSMFSNRFEGDLYTVGRVDGHPVYRYGRPLFLGVDV